MVCLTDFLTKQELDGLHFLYAIRVHYCIYKQIEQMSEYTIWSAIFVY